MLRGLSLPLPFSLSKILVLLAVGACLGAALPAMGQTDVNDVHVVPRTVEKAKAEEVPKESIVSPSLKTQVRPLKVSADLVLVPVTITDPMNRLVTGLEKENFPAV
jgi:Ca-activated chloride channel homolog